MKWLDFLFWHYYCHFDQSKIRTKDADLTGGTIVILLFTLANIIGVLLGSFNTFVYDIETIINGGELKVLCVLSAAILWLCLRYRYCKQKSIIKGKYKMFRERWGDSEHVSKKNMRILLWYTILSTIGVLIDITIMGTLNKHGYFEGCRLFP